MKRTYMIPNSGVYEFNSIDYVEHPWGDFVLSYGKGFDLIIDGGPRIHIPKYPNSSVAYFHRDEDGIVDHIWLGHPNEGPQENSKCPLCNRIVR